MFKKWLIAGLLLAVPPAAWAGLIGGKPVQTWVQTENTTLKIDENIAPILPRLAVNCPRSCALKITLSAAVDLTEPETTIYAEAIVNDGTGGIFPFDLVPLVQNLPIGSLRAPLNWTWVTAARAPGLQTVDVLLFTNGKSIQLNSRSITVEVLEQSRAEAS